MKINELANGVSSMRWVIFVSFSKLFDILRHFGQVASKVKQFADGKTISLF